MPTLYASLKQETGEVDVKFTNAVEEGFVAIGSFVHPDATYPDSYVIYHGVRDLLYKRKASDPSQVGFWPDNITDMQSITIKAEEPVKVTGVTLNKSTSTGQVGGNETLVATVAPTNATDKSVVWSTSDATKATVDQTGKVVLTGVGTVTITATTKDGNYAASCEYTVTEAA